MLAYLVTLELQARANANANTNASDARAVRRLPFRLIVCGRGAPLRSHVDGLLARGAVWQRRRVHAHAEQDDRSTTAASRRRRRGR